MQDVSITFGKVVATPTASSWSQAYNAGSLFAVLSLSTDNDTLLNALGKDVIKTLEGEYFTLEEKTLESIQHAVSLSAKKIPEEITVSFVVATLVHDILYVYLYGNGEITIRRTDMVGKLLSGEHTEKRTVMSASGHVENNDAIVLQTAAFAELIDKESLKEALSSLLPSDAAESLAPKVHAKEAGDASAIILYFKTVAPVAFTAHEPLAEVTNPEPKTIANEDIKEPEKDEDELIKNETSEPERIQHEPIIVDHTPHAQNQEPEYAVDTKPKRFKVPSFSKFLTAFKTINHTRKLILSIVIIVLAVFATSIYFASKHKENQQLQTEFNQVFPPARDKYQQAQVLENLNAPLSHDDYLSAQKMLTESQDKFPQGSTERKQIDDLLAKINAKVGPPGSNTQTTGSGNAQKVNTDNNILFAEQKNPSFNYCVQTDDSKTYCIDTSGISQIDSSGKATQISKKADRYTTTGGLATYDGNLYVLDKDSNQIVKFISPNWSTTNYLVESEKPDFSKAQAITIDTAIYVLYSDGSVDKYLRGAKQTFALSNLNKPLNNPTRIFTTNDDQNLYVLDNGNSRISVFGKNGAFQSEILSPLLKIAKDFWVSETDKKIFFLSSGTIYSLPLK